jgi:KaiC/GvpD/RAD55 family RecA-like ATPase
MLKLSRRNKNMEKTYTALSGISNLDEIIEGFHGGELVIIGSRPSIGKTAFALTLSKNIIMKKNTEICFFSLEMSKEAIEKRMEKMGIDLNISLMHIIDNPSITINKLQNTVDEKVRTTKTKIIFVDYFGLLPKDISEQDTMETLKKLAVDLNITVIILFQLPRNIEKQKPELEHFPSSRNCADIILALYREKMEASDDSKIATTLILLKNNVNRKLGFIKIWFDKEHLLFENDQPMAEKTFSKWVKFSNRAMELEQLDRKYPGIYAIARSKKDISNKPFSLIKDIVYFGMTNSKGGLKSRLKQFENTINGGTGHGGAERFRNNLKTEKGWKDELYVSIMVFEGCDVTSNKSDDLMIMGEIEKEEYVWFANYVKDFNELPRFNDKKNSPKKDKELK